MQRQDNLNTGSGNATLKIALGNIPESFRNRIVDSYLDLKRRGRTSDAIGASTSVSSFCESVLRFLQETLTGKHVPFGTHIANFNDACAALAQVPSSVTNESQRLIIPKALLFIQTLRNKRGMGHAGGEVDANVIDLAVAVSTADWVVCELMRAYHQFSLQEAQSFLERLATRQIPDVWVVGKTKRVLTEGLDKKTQTMLLLYGEVSPVAVGSLFLWVEYSRLFNFKRDVLEPLHQDRMIEWDRAAEMVLLSPKGEQHIEACVLTS